MTSAALQHKSELETELQGIVARLVQRYHPVCVILFGSLARGEVGEWSDIDLCMINDTELPFLQRLHEARLVAAAHEAMDIVVYTPGEWQEMLRQGNYFVRDEILGAGRVLHGRPA